jgi:hypothetical protein
MTYQPIAANNDSYYLEYFYQPNTTYDYDIVQSIEPGNDSILMNISILAVNDGENLRLIMILNATEDQDNVLSINNVTIDRQGNVIEFDENSDFLPEIRPEIPIQVIYPKQKITDHSLWVIRLNKTGSYMTSNETVEYNLTGIITYSCIGQQMIRVKNNTFNCICIESNTTFNLYTKSNTSSGYLLTNTTGRIDGSNWVDAEKGFLVKAIYDQNSVLLQDYSDIYKKIGYFNSFKAEIPTRAHVASEIRQST